MRTLETSGKTNDKQQQRNYVPPIVPRRLWLFFLKPPSLGCISLFLVDGGDVFVMEFGYCSWSDIFSYDFSV